MNKLNIGKNIAFLTVASVVAIGCASTGPTLEEFSASIPQHSATTPAHRMVQDWWKNRHEGVLKQIQEKIPELILIGDSITHGWDSHMDIWNDHFGDYPMVNMGFSGDRTQHVLWRFEHGEIDGISPKLAVIMIGTNNSNGKDNTAQEIGDGIAAICANLRADLPDTEVLILSIFPRGHRPTGQRKKNEGASRFARGIARSDKHIHYLGMTKPFLNPDGTLAKAVMPDFLHPGTKGYTIWASAMEDRVHKLMSR